VTLRFEPGCARPASATAGDQRRKGVNGTVSTLHAIMDVIRRDERGQGLAEYALILALIAIVAIIALLFLGGQVSTILSTVGNSV
jgi:pilus assembly protein Flp/PilA